MVVLDYGSGRWFGGRGFAEGLLLLDVVGEVAKGLVVGLECAQLIYNGQGCVV